MKKFLYFFAMAAVGIAFTACSNDDDNNDAPESTAKPSLEQNYFTIENATYTAGTMPEATTNEVLEGVDMSDQVMNGAMNYITVVTSQDVEKFYLAIKGVDGYLTYNPTQSRAANSLNTYTIPVMIAEAYSGDHTLVLSAALNGGKVTIPAEFPLYQLETRKGDLEVKLAFSNEKDIDLHLVTPTGVHIYYASSRYGEYSDYYGDYNFGLDIDSNAGCSIDGINKENIYIPAEYVVNGEYVVIVNMYANCNRSIATDWSIVTRYKGELVAAKTGRNPASGTYEVNAEEFDYTVAMTFNITGANGSMPEGEGFLGYYPESRGIEIKEAEGTPEEILEMIRAKARENRN